MSIISSQQTIGEMVVEKPNRSKFFEVLGFDYCCGGKKTLEEACIGKGLDPQFIMEQLSSFDQQQKDQTGLTDWSSVSLNEIIEHILTVHHVYTKQALERLDKLVTKVARVHGSNHHELLLVQEIYTRMQNELLVHMEKEEKILFPYVQQLEVSERLPQFHCGSINNPIQVMLREHEDTGKQLEVIRELTHDYTAPADACNTYRAMLDGLAELEADLHQHIHKENNLLFPKVLQRASELATV